MFVKHENNELNDLHNLLFTHKTNSTNPRGSIPEQMELEDPKRNQLAKVHLEK